MPLQTIRVTPADRKNGKAKQDDKPASPPGMGRRRSSSSERGDICRICHCEAAPELPLISPCCCAGSLRFVHQQCLQQWIKSSDAVRCELCKFRFVMRTTLKPFTKWEKLEMSPVERRKVLCSVAFHAVAVTCVVWSLYVLIERTAEEVRSGALEWPFWTKLVVVGVGLTGGVVFMYVQCRMYVQLFRRWRAYNRLILVMDAPLKNQQAMFSAAAQLTASVLAAEDKRTSTDEDEFHSCESGSSASVDGAGQDTPTAEEAAVAETGSTRTTLTSVTDNAAAAAGEHPLSEVVVVAPSTGGDHASDTQSQQVNS